MLNSSLRQVRFKQHSYQAADAAPIRWLLCIGTLFAVVFLLIYVIPAMANTTVGNGTPESCTAAALQEGIAAGGLITFHCGQGPQNKVTISISEVIEVTVPVVIDGGVKGEIILDGGDPGTGDLSGPSLLQIAPGVEAELRNLELSHAGNSTIVNHGNLEMESVDILYSRAQTCAGILSDGNLTILGSSVISTNTALTYGGGVCILAGTASLKETAINFNSAEHGGGLYLAGNSHLVDRDSYYGSNMASSSGAGIFVGPGASYEANFTAVANNVATPAQQTLGGGIFNQGSVTIYASVITANEAHDGAGIYNEGSFTVRDSDIDQNAASPDTGRGGGLFNQGQARYLSSSLVQNRAANGGGVYNAGQLEITNSTLSQNQATAGGNLLAGGQPVCATAHYWKIRRKIST